MDSPSLATFRSLYFDQMNLCDPGHLFILQATGNLEARAHDFHLVG